MSDSKKDTLLKRKDFMVLGTCAGIGALATVASGIGVYKYLDPVVSYGIPKKFRITTDDIPDKGEELVFSDQKVLLRRTRSGSLAAISLVCTHLGCTVNRVTTGFQCPCHGSQYDDDGIVVGGPAPRTLPWHSIKELPGDQLEIDTGTALDENTYFPVSV